MRFIHTFYSKPLIENKFNKYDVLIEVVLFDYTYSAMCVKRSGNEIVLYTDKLGAEILSNIPYDHVNVLDFDESIDFAAAIKFEAIKEMGKEDALIDGDLFVQKKKCCDIIQSYNKYDFVYSFFEPNSYTLSSDKMIGYYTKLLDKLNAKSYLFVSPYELPKSLNDLCWPNTSFMKFNNMKLKEEYINQYFNFKDQFKDIDFEDTWPDIILEQYNMKSLLSTGYSSKALIENFPTIESNDYALNIGFTHLGTGKIYYNDYFKNLMKWDFPLEYDKLLKQTRKYKEKNNF